jgi:hypothetical protein
MAIQHDFFDIEQDFFGVNDSFGNATAGSLSPLTIRDISVAGAPTYGFVDGSSRGELSVAMATDVEIENLCLYQDDVLQFDIDKIIEVSWRVKLNQALLDSKSMFSVGVIGDRNDAIDSIAQSVLFRVVAASAAVTVETDDGTTETSLVATDTTLAAAYKTLTINFAAGTNDVRFFIDGEPVATATTFDMSAYTGKLQLFAQIQKTSDSNADGFTADWVQVTGRN